MTFKLEIKAAVICRVRELRGKTTGRLSSKEIEDTVSKEFSISQASVRNWLRKEREISDASDYAMLPMKRAGAITMEEFRKRFDKNPRESRADLAAHFRVSIPTIDAMIRKVRDENSMIAYGIKDLNFLGIKR